MRESWGGDVLILPYQGFPRGARGPLIGVQRDTSRCLRTCEGGHREPEMTEMYSLMSRKKIDILVDEGSPKNPQKKFPEK